MGLLGKFHTESTITKSKKKGFITAFDNEQKKLFHSQLGCESSDLESSSIETKKSTKEQKSKGIKRKNKDKMNAKTSPRANENNTEDASNTVTMAVDCVAGGLGEEGKVISEKATKRIKKPCLDIRDSELQSSFHEEEISLAEGPFANNNRGIDGVKKTGKNNVHSQRRILANARERSRVHKLGEAFRMLRNVIPSFSADQKLSKLSTLRIAVSYISALGSLLDLDVKPGAKQVFTSSVNQCTFALQSEFGRAKGTRRSKSKVDKSTKSKSRKNNK